MTDHDAHDDYAARVLLAGERAAAGQRRAEQWQQAVSRAGSGDTLHHAVNLDARVASFDLGDIDECLARLSQESNAVPEAAYTLGMSRVSASIATIRLASGYGGDRQSTAWTTLKIATLRPMPSAIVRMTTVA